MWCLSCICPLSGKAHPPIKSYTGLWDTGASGTVITKKVVDDLGLLPVGKTKVNHADGESIVNVDYVNIFLPNQVGFKFIKVTEGKLGNIDILIGMDIITKGDFTVINFAGKTTFTFRVPSLEEIDFVSSSVEVKPVETKATIGRNQLCSCGSKKKYKHCHGKDK